MTVFVDTSGLYAVLDRDDRNHPAARTRWGELASQEALLVTTNYILVEVLALTQRRLGVQAVQALVSDALPIIQIEWVSEADHVAALAALLAAGRRDLSFVDLVSFQVMRRLSLREAFTFDGHFREQGFTSLA